MEVIPSTIWTSDPYSYTSHSSSLYFEDMLPSNATASESMINPLIILLRDVVPGRLAMFGVMLCLQQAAFASWNSFACIGILLLVLSIIRCLLDYSPSNAVWLRREQSPEQWYAIICEAARLVVKGWILFFAVRDFGCLFAFLLEYADSNLLSPYRHSQSTSSKLVIPRTWTYPALVLGYICVAGVDAYEYGSLLETLVLLAAALACGHVQHVIPELKTGIASPQFQLVSSVFGAVITIPCMLISQLPWAPSTTHIGSVLVSESRPWILGVLICAGWLQWFSHSALLRPKILIVAGSKQQRVSLLLCSLTGLLCALIVSALEVNWTRFFAELTMSGVILAAQYHAIWESSNILIHPQSWDQEDAQAGKEKKGTQWHTIDKEPLVNVTSFSATAVLQDLWKREDSQKMLLFLAVNVSFMFVELIVGMWSNSLGLIGDAGHMFFDNGALMIGLVASYIAKLPPDAHYTYGYGRVEVLSGFLNSILLLIISFHLMAEAISRFLDPPQVKPDNLLLTSVLGLLVNIVGLVWFHDHAHGHGHAHDHNHGHSPGHTHGHGNHHLHHQSHGEQAEQYSGISPFASGNSSNNSNMHGVYLHVLADTLGSIGVIISSLLIQTMGWHVTDPISSALISILIVMSSFPLLKDTLLQLLQRVPKDIEHDVALALDDVQTIVPGVKRIHRWHIWRHVADTCVGSLHLIVDYTVDEQDVLRRTREIWQHRLRSQAINKYLTIEIEKEVPGDLVLSNCNQTSAISTFENPAGENQHLQHHYRYHEAAAATKAACCSQTYGQDLPLPTWKTLPSNQFAESACSSHHNYHAH